MTLEEVMIHAQALPSFERGLLAERLRATLDAEPKDDAFDRELGRRLAEHDAGQDPGVSRAEAMAELRRGLS